MGTVSTTGTTVAGQNSGTICSVALPAFTGVFTFRATSDTPMPTGAIVNLRVNFIRSSTPTTCVSFLMTLGATGTTVSQTWTVGSAGPLWSCLDWDSASLSIDSALGMPAATWTLEISGTGIVVTYCEYGVEPNPDAPIYETLTDTTVDLVVAVALAGVAAPEVIAVVETAMLAIEGSIWFGMNCSILPDLSQESLDIPNIATWSPDRLLRWFQAAAWHFFCRCKAAPGGSPPPAHPPTPPIIPPPGGATPAPLICDATDICTYLTQMKSLMDQMNRQIAATRQDVMFIQRQHVPKGYQNGTLHTGLTGTGSLTVSGILGLVVSLTTSPPGIGSDMDSTARTYYGVGHVNIGTADGWLHRVSIGHSPQLVLDIDPDVTQVEYSFVPGTTASIQELLALP